MQLLTKEILKKFEKKGRQEKISDPSIIVKFFDPTGSWSWFATEFDPKTRIFFGMVHGHDKELGYFSLDELEKFKGSFGLGIERDKYFGFGKKLSDLKI